MAIIFELWAECSSREACEALAAHFSGLEHELLTGRPVRWRTNVGGPPHSPIGVTVWSPDLSRYGVRSVCDALESTEAALHLYAHLRAGPSFRFAYVAWEAGNVLMNELSEYMTQMGNGECRLDVDCVVDDDLFRELGSPKFCHRFREGYWWTRYRGELYRPLYSADQAELNALFRRLFPECFAY